MAKRRYKKSRSNKMKRIPVPIVAAVAVPAVDGLKAMLGGDITGGANNLIYNYTGMAQGTFHADRFLATYLPVGGAVIIHKVLAPRVNPYIPAWLHIGL